MHTIQAVAARESIEHFHYAMSRMGARLGPACHHAYMKPICAHNVVLQ